MKRLSISESSQVGEARREALALARKLGFDETEAGKAALAATEAASNILKHARSGELLLRAVDEAGPRGVEILSLDSGPGMTDLAKCLRDGYSTSGSPGTGLGAMARISSFFDVYSQPGGGTALVVRLLREKMTPPNGLEVGVVSVPRTGEEDCGDAFWVDRGPNVVRILLADGLGHGLEASRAASQAVEVFEESRELGLSDLLWAIHLGLRPTRGAAVAVADIDPKNGVLCYSGVGNIGGAILHQGKRRGLVSVNGIAGHKVRKVQVFTYPWPEGALLILHSDGLSTRFSLDGYPGLGERHPSLAAGILYRDFTRGSDDVTVLAARTSRP